MTNSVRFAAVLIAAPLLCAAAAFAQAPVPQTQAVDVQKLYAEIAGEYTFDMGGQTQVIVFAVKDGELWGAPVDEPQEKLVPVKDKPLSFEVTVSSNGNFFELEFVRNDKGVIFKCVLNAQGMTIEGLKTIK
jgi:hypothetical protein